jgi:DNA-binding MarR family transcriptional regulator
MTEPDYASLARFRRALRSFLAFSEQAARAAGITPAQHQLLLAVKGTEAAEPPPSIGAVADALKLRHHSVVELVDRAVAAGLVHREQDPDDARCQRLILTPLGEGKLRDLSVLHSGELRRFREAVLEHLAPLG